MLGVFQCVLSLCCVPGIILGDASLLDMKHYPFLVKRIDRSVRAIGSCTDINNNKISNGKYYVPPGENACRNCKCVFGQPGECYTTKCAVPTCKDYKAVAGQCCRFTCPKESSNSTQLAVIISLSLGLLVLIIILIVVISRNIKKNRRRHNQQQQQPPIREEHAPLNNQLPAIQEEQEQQFEPPPPYTPVRNANKYKTRHNNHGNVIPNEPPPPYEIQTSLRATTV
ncbi:integral membrane protein DGCR2/IDD isoform X2 [Exaiptasia diaphana]|uniref:Integral membrane protein DGCR2/IDD n=1 Tax=Exaiptasia diaphana TaxID=2652724 RepID=A0A913Y0M7_EXADI|nr:integral membrane protein DGCR2/IDD isoform X2 [Exaiptasia diaphana]